MTIRDPIFRAERGIALLETIVYIGLFFLVAGLAFALFYRTEEQSRFLRRSTDDIAAAMKAGERWRADVRAAVKPPAVEGNALRIQQSNADVRYFVSSNAVWRQVGSKPVRVLDNVEASAFERDQRQLVTAWRWNVELKKRRHQSSMRPLFGFSAVPEMKTAR